MGAPYFRLMCSLLALDEAGVLMDYGAVRLQDGFGLGCLKLLGMWTFLDRCLGVVLHLRFGAQICGDLSFLFPFVCPPALARIVQAQGPPSGPDAWPLHLVLLGRVRILGLCVRLGPCGADERVTWHLGCAGWCPSWLWVCLLSFGSSGAVGSSF